MTYNKRLAALLLTILALLMPVSAAMAAGGSGHTYAQDVQITEACYTGPAHPAYKPCQRQRHSQVIPCHVDMVLARPAAVAFAWDGSMPDAWSKPIAAVAGFHDVDIPPPRVA